MKKTIVSTNRLMILAMMMVITISARSAMPLATIGTQERRSFRTQIKSTFCLYICLSKGHGEFSGMGVPFLHIKRELIRQLRHFIKHDVADSAIWRFNVEKAQAVIRY